MDPRSLPANIANKHEYNAEGCCPNAQPQRWFAKEAERAYVKMRICPDRPAPARQLFYTHNVNHGWDIDLDDGSSNYEIYKNLMLAGGLKLREGFRRKAYNNILINNGLHPHVWFEESGDEFTRNIVMAAHAPVQQPDGWGVASDRNLFTVEANLLKSQGQGADANSFRSDDLVQKINGQSVRTAEELLAEVAKAESKQLRVQIIRNQQPMELLVGSSR